MASIRSLSRASMALLINTLNQVVQGEKGKAMFAGREEIKIERQIGVIGCLPFKFFSDQRYQWAHMGFVSRMLPFAYSYSADLIAVIKDGIDKGRMKSEPSKMPTLKARSINMSPSYVAAVRAIADSRAVTLGQIGIRLLKHYHTLIRAHALRHGRSSVTRDDLDFLRAVDGFISVTECRPL